MGKKILIIGNGFDLAHGLLTDYVSFLKVSQRLLSILTSGENQERYEKTNKEVLSDDKYKYVRYTLKTLYSSRKKKEGYNKLPNNIQYMFEDIELNELFKCLYNNVWFVYLKGLMKNNQIKGINWIDFESEISEIIQFLDSSGVKNYEEANKIPKGGDKFESFRACTIKLGYNYDIIMDDYINRLYDELKALIRGLGIYLKYFVDNVDIEPLKLINSMGEYDYVISFNYTHTFERLYGSDVPCCHIHGEVGNMANSNMVLGIDEYWDDSKKDEKTDYAIFKKFVQRIRNRNSIQYKGWLNVIIEEYNQQVEVNGLDSHAVVDKTDVYIYGHSLDITDKDILKEFIGNDAFRVNIYAKDEQNEGKLIANAIRLIGEDKLIEKATSLPRDMIFNVLY